MSLTAQVNWSLCMLGLLIALPIGCLALLLVRRLVLHPLSHFPGPKLASLTSLYKSYHEVIRGGKWLHHVDDLHKAYGDVVRVGPNEVTIVLWPHPTQTPYPRPDSHTRDPQLHFNDPRVYNKIFSVSAQFTKDPAFYTCFGVDTSTFGLMDPEQARLSRELMSIYFNRRAILQLEGVIQSKVDKLAQLLSSRKIPSDMFYAFRCATMDIITTHCFDSSNAECLDAPDFHAPLLSDIQAGVSLLWTIKSFPWMLSVICILPEWLGFSGQLEAFIRVQEYIVNRIEQVKRLVFSPQETKHASVMYDLLNRFPTLEPVRMFHEALSLIQAGSDPVATACLIGFFHVLKDPSVHAQLKQELREAFPQLTDTPTWSDFERVPYLTAVIKESLRMSHGFVSAIPRVVGPCGAELAGHYIPPNTVVSISAVSVHNDPMIFLEPHRFRPERWLKRDLGQYLVAFSKGPRMCLGINMAWAELYILFGTLFRRLDMTLVDTRHEDYADFLDYFIPIHTGNHLHIQAVRSAT